MAITRETDDFISGEFKGADYRDAAEKTLADGEYKYTLKAEGAGKIAFKVEAQLVSTPDFDDPKEKKSWVTVEEKSEIRGGTTLEGHFTANGDRDEDTLIKFIFKREFAGNPVNYEMKLEKVS